MPPAHVPCDSCERNTRRPYQVPTLLRPEGEHRVLRTTTRRALLHRADPGQHLGLKVGDDWEEGAVFALRDRTGDARMCAPHGGCAFRLCGHEDPRAAGWAIRS